MGMVIQNNIGAIGARNKLNTNVTGLKKSSEKLSSGYRINRAGDDAAGLAISEKMRSQIRGLSQAVRNAQDGISLVQTFEGALAQTQDIIQRAKALAEESANGTYQNQVDRDAIELEYRQLCDEVDHIAETDFNGVIMLTGGKIVRPTTVADLKQQTISTFSQAPAGGDMVKAQESGLGTEGTAIFSGSIENVTEQAMGASSVTEVDISKGNYTIKSAGTYRITGSTTTNMLSVNSGLTGVTIILDNASITKSSGNAPINLNDASVEIQLVGTSTIRSNVGSMAGINVASGGSLTISGSGKLNAYGGTNASGIGGSSSRDCGSITINSGTVNATGGSSCGAGIGGKTVSSITITGGTVNATGFGTAAAIGSQGSGAATGIKITGGTVNAYAPQGDDIGGGVGATNVGVTLNGNAVIKADTIAGSPIAEASGTFFEVSSSTTTVHGNMKLDDVLDLTGKTLKFATGAKLTGIVKDGNNYTVYGNVTLDDPNLLDPSNKITIAEGATLTVKNGVDITANGIQNNGTLNINGSVESTADIVNKGTMTNSGTLTSDGAVSNTGTFTNSGTLTSDGAISNTGTFTNSGTLNNNAGFNNKGTFTNTGTVNNGGSIENSGSFTNKGAIVNKSGSTISNSSKMTNSGTLINNGSISNDGNLLNNGTLNNNGTINNKGQIDNSGTLNNDRNMNINGGLILSEGTINNTTSGSINAGNGTLLSKPGSTLNNEGLMEGRIIDRSHEVTPVSVRLTQGEAPLTYPPSIVLHIGSKSKDAINFNFAYTSSGIGNLENDLDCTAEGLGLNSLSLKTEAKANIAIDKLDNALCKVSMVRATFGALQNRLEHKVENMTTTKQNITEAESHIRDTDMASEITNYTKENILREVSQSILAQANQQTQAIVQLLG